MGARYWVSAIVLGLTVIAVALGITVFEEALWSLVLLAPLLALAAWDLAQRGNNVLRNYPLLGHIRGMAEAIHPQIYQYFIEGDEDGTPFNREQRSIVYQRSTDESDKRAFGTELHVGADDYYWLNHSIAARTPESHDFRLTIGCDRCARPYDASVYNISAMSFGSLGSHAIQALNKGAKLGRFAHDTGEGGLSQYHLEHGGDLIWEIGSGYFGCRTKDGSFDPERFAEKATNDTVRMIEVKLSQGAKPGHGGVLPAAKLTKEIAEAREVEMGQDVISPPSHSAFSTPREMMQFIDRLREMSGGKPTGFKLCVGNRWEFMGIVKAMLDTGILPDFIVVDGAEGGTGAAPLELQNHVGTPLVEGLTFVRNALVATGLRERIRIGASGKLVTAADILRARAFGADWCNSARGFMFALGCIQSQRCHTNRCPTGITTQNPWRQHALVVDEKAERVATFHRRTLTALAETLGTAGFSHPHDVGAEHLFVRARDGSVLRSDVAYPIPEPGCLLQGATDTPLAESWSLASADTFAAVA